MLAATARRAARRVANPGRTVPCRSSSIGAHLRRSRKQSADAVRSDEQRGAAREYSTQGGELAAQVAAVGTQAIHPSPVLSGSSLTDCLWLQAAAAADCSIPSPEECWSGGQLSALTPEVLAHAEHTFLKNGMWCADFSSLAYTYWCFMLCFRWFWADFRWENGAASSRQR